MTASVRVRRRVGGAGLVGVLAVLSAAPSVPAVAAPRPAQPTAANVQSQEWWLDALHLRSAWTTTKGRGVTVGLIDSGVDASHPDLQGALVPGKDFSGEGAANGEAPIRGIEPDHGTTMAGFIAGRGHGAGNREGLLGAAPEAKIMSVSIDTEKSGGGPFVNAVHWAVDHGATVLNLSLGGFDQASERAGVAYAEAHDAVVVVGAGNQAQADTVSTLAGLPGAVAVSGVVDDGQFSLDPGSNAGGPQTLDPTSHKATDYVGGVAVSAPWGTHAGANDLPSITTVKDGSYASTGGTSNATAIVSGVVALIRSAHPKWNSAQVIQSLISTAYRPPGKGYSSKHGFGVPDAAKAVAAATPNTCENPLGSLTTDSAGIWPTINAHPTALTYTPQCSTPGSSSSSTPSSNPPSSASGGASSAPASSPAQASSGGSGGSSSWIWIVVAVLVVGAVTAFVLARRRGGRGGPPAGGGPSTGGPPPGSYPPPAPGGYGPPPTGPGGWSPPPSGPHR